MKRNYNILTIALIAFACNAGKADHSSKKNAQQQVNKTDTTRLVNFPKTHIYIKLPNGYQWSDAATGFYRDADGGIIKYDEFKTMRYAAQMPVEETGNTLVNQKAVTISGYSGIIKTYENGSTGKKLILSFGDNTFMDFIEASYFTNSTAAEEEILKALQTIKKIN
ncbi:MAG: hypothetical protein RIR12_2625 [Bacteroidota bacterium]|jgi:hypothetical protein